jgi:hypothetical protein
MTKMMCSLSSISALFVTLSACSVPAQVSPEQTAQNAATPGWTGHTFVPGSNSTIAGDADATYRQQKWGTGRR